MYSGRKAKRSALKHNAGNKKSHKQAYSAVAAHANVMATNLKQLMLDLNIETVQEKPKRRKRAKLLCKVVCSMETWTFYRDKTFRTDALDGCDVVQEGRWDLAFSDNHGPIFLYSETLDTDEHFVTNWNSADPEEKKLAETIANALADIEMENVLKGKYDEAGTKTNDRPKKRPKHAKRQDRGSGSPCLDGSAAGRTEKIKTSDSSDGGMAE